MQRRTPRYRERNLLFGDLLDHINPKNPLIILSKKIPWKEFEESFSSKYSQNGRPAKPIRLMVGLLILKQMYNLIQVYQVDKLELI